MDRVTCGLLFACLTACTEICLKVWLLSVNFQHTSGEQKQLDAIVSSVARMPTLPNVTAVISQHHFMSRQVCSILRTWMCSFMKLVSLSDRRCSLGLQVVQDGLSPGTFVMGYVDFLEALAHFANLLCPPTDSQLAQYLGVKQGDKLGESSMWKFYSMVRAVAGHSTSAC